MTAPSVVLPSVGCAGVVVAEGTAHIATSFSGSGPLTRLGQMTTARLCASIRFEADRNETSCSRSGKIVFSISFENKVKKM